MGIEFFNAPPVVPAAEEGLSFLGQCAVIALAGLLLLALLQSLSRS